MDLELAGIDCSVTCAVTETGIKHIATKTGYFMATPFVPC